MSTELLFRQQSDLEDTARELWEQRSAWYESGLAPQWRSRMRWALGELRTVRRFIAQHHASQFWSYVLVG